MDDNQLINVKIYVLENIYRYWKYFGRFEYKKSHTIINVITFSFKSKDI